MSDLRGNTIAGAVLASVLGVMGLGFVADELFHPNQSGGVGFAPEIETAGAGGEAAPSQPAGPPDWGTLFADSAQLASLVERGDRVHRQCTSCHTFVAGGANGTGPALYDVFGRVAGAVPGFNYSPAMVEYGQPWSYDNLYEYLRAPASYIRGTRMAFAGIRNAEDRAAIVAYLRSLEPSPPALPAPRPAAAAPEAAPADGAAAPAAGAAPAAPTPN